MSIRNKLTLIIMASCTILLLFISTVLFVSEFYARQLSLEQQMAVLSGSLAEQLKKTLVLERYQQAEPILQSLRQQANIKACYLFDHQGELVQEYLAPGSSPILLPALKNDFPREGQSDSFREQRARFYLGYNYFSSFTPVFYENTQVGTLYLLSNLEDFYRWIYTVLLGVCVATALLVLFSLVLAKVMQQPISVPLIDLTTMMSRISKSRDYSLRARRKSDDEIGLLVDGFNDMLEQVETHQRDLTQHQFHLEQMVDERTSALLTAVDELEIARQQADTANVAKSDFLSRMTHELRTPLIGVLGMNELLARTLLDEQQTFLVDTVQKSGEELLRLISDVLDFSRIEAGKLTLASVPASLSKTLDSIVALLTPQAREKGLDLVADIPLDATCTVLADDVRVRQIMMNLIGNAIKFTDRGQVLVSLACDMLTQEQARFSISVADTGCGISAEASKKIFDVFYQVDGSDTRSKTGAGLGLAIVAQLVELMGGEIGYHETSKGGSCFTVTLPLPVLESRPPDVLTHYADKRFLLCGPETLHYRQLFKKLTSISNDVQWVHQGVDALFLLRSSGRGGEAIDLLLVDAEMLLPTGEPFYQLLRCDAQLRNSKRILLKFAHDSSCPLDRHEQRLVFPVGWVELESCLQHSWHSLRLIDGKRDEMVDSSAAGEETAAICLVSNNVASRELLRLTVVKQWPQATVTALDFDRYADLKQEGPQLVFFDLDHLDSDLIHACLADGNGDKKTTVLLSQRPLSPTLEPLTDYRFSMPLRSESLSRIDFPAAERSGPLAEGNDR